MIILLCVFIFTDPFGIVYKDLPLVEPSEDVVKTRHYLNEAYEKNYPSFIFGNSRAHSFTNPVWQSITQSGPLFDFGSPGECLLNVKRKLEIVLKHQQIKQVAILVDEGMLLNTDNTHKFYQGPVYNHSPQTSYTSSFAFYSNYIRYFFSDFFFLKYIYYLCTGEYKAWMKNAFNDPDALPRPVKSHEYVSLADSLINTDFRKYKEEFSPDYSYFSKSIRSVSAQDSVHLIEIRDLLERNGVKYVVIIPPDFSQKKVADPIRSALSRIMGRHLYDFSGSNAITKDSTLNFENLHFTPKAAAMILDSVYNARPLRRTVPL